MKPLPIDTLHKPGTSLLNQKPKLTDYVAIWDGVALASSQAKAVTHVGEIDTRQTCVGLNSVLSTVPSDELFQ